MQTVYALLAHGVVLLHFAFVLFVALGGFLVLKNGRWAWVHLPCALWGGWVEVAGWVCPLTPLENHFRAMAGLDPYSGDFVARTLLAVLYPEGLTRAVQLILGVTVLAGNAVLYLWAFRKRP